MPSAATVEAFIAAVESGAHADFTGKDGRRMHMEELAWQRWEGERIAQEEFFYDPRANEIDLGARMTGLIVRRLPFARDW